MSTRLALAALILLTGCAQKLSQLPRPKDQQSFVLASQHTRVEKRGLGYTWVEGLRAGKYTLVAEDAQGRYFLGEGSSVIRLSNDNAEKFLKTGEIALPVRGGLWLPKVGVQAEPRIWFEMHYGAPTMAPGTAPGLAAIGNASMAASEGDILFIGYGSEKQFVAGIRILRQ